MSFFENIFRQPSSEKKAQRHGKSVLHIEGEQSGIGGGSSPERNESPEEAERRLASGFDAILSSLKADPENLKDRIDRLKSLPDQNGILSKLERHFSPDHWEMLAVLEAYDRKTFDHSLRVASYVHAIAAKNSETGTFLRQQVTLERGSLDDLYTASLFHDIGKTIIPETILHDDHSRREWAKRSNEWAAKHGLDPYFDQEKLQSLDDADLDRYFMQLHATNGTDPLNIVPLEGFLLPDEVAELERRGIPKESTLREVLEYHERATKAILRRDGMYVASDIASHHHDYDGIPIRSERYPSELSAVRIGFELSILRSADLYDALTSDREYKKPHHPLIALEVLIRDAETEFTEPEITKRVVRDLYRHIEAAGRHLPGNDAESRAKERVLAFIG